MPPSNSLSSDDCRKRKSHKKSRKGCGNCKLRRCDESKPRCKKCQAYGVTCFYNSAPDAGALSVEVAFRVDLSTPPNRPAAPLLRSIPAPLPCTGSIDSPDAAYQLTPVDVRLLERFQKSIILTIGTQSSRGIYQRKTLPIAFCHPFVMHTVLSLSYLHLSTSPPPAFAYHYYRAVSLLHRKLSRPVLDSERDALWIAAAFIGVASFANMPDVTRPSEAWPLRAKNASDLDWMKLSHGKKQVWKLTDPMREAGIFRDVAKEVYVHLMAPRASFKDGLGEFGVLERRLPAGFCDLFQLRELLPEENPYWSAAEALAHCWGVQCDPGSKDVVLPCLSFISRLDPRYKDLLEEKDDRAMLLLAYWYTKVCEQRQWWMWRRAVLETRAICELLEERWTGRREASLIEFPKMVAARCAL
ncbi:Sterol regulatory element-binding protein ECM22 [Colletotrichum sidae]|uniref:Sterol regulatory element-binding protein ECM22 n=1 Tax=Colletotrichum sidae TaxID=1347389 RepID=A0A4R8TMF7_9PEZI|nr:Sterol regulatory element-binding protein ECM22 [Colletotrichum sidae]